MGLSPKETIYTLIFICMCITTYCLYKQKQHWRLAYIATDKFVSEMIYEIDCLEWKYETDKVLLDGDFSHRISNRRKRTRDGYEYSRPYMTSKQWDSERQARNKENS